MNRMLISLPLFIFFYYVPQVHDDDTPQVQGVGTTPPTRVHGLHIPNPSPSITHPFQLLHYLLRLHTSLQPRL